MPFRIERVQPRIRSKWFSARLDSKALSELRNIEARLVKATRNPRLQHFVTPMQAIEQHSLLATVQRIPAVVQRVQAIEQPHSARLRVMVNDAVGRAFGRNILQFLGNVEKMPLSIAGMPEQLVPVAAERKQRLLAIADKLRLQSMLAHGTAFFMQERMLKLYKRPLDKMNPALYPMYELLNSYMRTAYYYFLSAGVPALPVQIGKGETRIEFVERMNKRTGERFFVPAASSQLRGAFFPAMLHEAGEAAAHVATKEISAKMLGYLPENERKFIMQQLHGFLPEIHSYIFGPVIFSSLREVMRLFAKLPLSEMPVEVERQAQRMLRDSYPNLREEEVQRVVNAWNGFLLLPFAKQKRFIEESLAAKTPKQRQLLAVKLRGELYKIIKIRRGQ